MAGAETAASGQAQRLTRRPLDPVDRCRPIGQGISRHDAPSGSARNVDEEQAERTSPFGSAEKRRTGVGRRGAGKTPHLRAVAGPGDTGSSDREVATDAKHVGRKLKVNRVVAKT